MKKYVTNHFLIKAFEGKKLLTTDHGSFVMLTNDEFKKIGDKKLPPPLEKKLYDAGILLDLKKSCEVEIALRNKKHYLFKGASLHIIVPTLRCNLSCIYCHASKKPANKKEYDMDEKTAKKTVDFIFQTPAKSIGIEFQGGEPLLNFEIIKYITSYAKRKNVKEKKQIHFSIVTNLTLMTEEKMRYLINENISICTSLDGPKKIHDKNRPRSYDQVIYWIKKINKEYKAKKSIQRISALITTTKNSLPYVKEIIDEYQKLGFNAVHLRYLNNLGDARPEWKNISYTPEEFLKYWDEGINHISTLRKKGVIMYERGYEIFNSKINRITDPGYLDIRSPCGAVIGQILYNYNGKIYTCDEGRSVGDDIFVVGNVHKNTYKEVTTSPNCINMINASTLETLPCDACAYKPFCGVCPVCNYGETGSLIAQTPNTSRCKIHKHQIEQVLRDTIKYLNPKTTKKIRR